MLKELESSCRITTEIDFDRPGRQASYLRAPLSRNDAGWGTVQIPIVVVSNGAGPTILLTGGVHGDEYEGQIAVSRLARELSPAEVQGRVVMLPAVNVPAVLADTRLSPVDNRDMNRCFPGDPRGTFTEMLAHFIDSRILPLVDVSVDVHTAGHSFDSALSTNMHYLPDQALRARTMEAAAAFGAPYNVVFWGVDEGATLTSSVERRGVLSLGTELGGWGRVNVEGVRIGERGIRNVLKHFGVIGGTPETAQRDGASGTSHMMVPDGDCYIFAPAAGLFEPRHVTAQAVEAGEVAGYLHTVENVDHAPIELRYRRSGLIWMSAGPGRVQRGDPVAVVMVEFDEAQIPA